MAGMVRSAQGNKSFQIVLEELHRKTPSKKRLGDDSTTGFSPQDFRTLLLWYQVSIPAWPCTDCCHDSSAGTTE